LQTEFLIVILRFGSGGGGGGGGGGGCGGGGDFNISPNSKIPLKFRPYFSKPFRERLLLTL